MIPVFIVDSDFQNRVYILDIAENLIYFIKKFKVNRKSKCFQKTYNVKIFCQDGERVLYSVWVWRRELTSSKTQNGSDLPPKSAAANPVARKTLTVKWPTSRKL